MELVNLYDFFDNKNLKKLYKITNYFLFLYLYANNARREIYILKVIN